MNDTPKLSDAGRRLLKALPVDGRWIDVPPSFRSVTVLALQRKGIIEHRYKQPRHFGDWVTWGEIRLLALPDL
jgi:hypothetical protein